MRTPVNTVSVVHDIQEEDEGDVQMDQSAVKKVTHIQIYHPTPLICTKQ
jgi:hypothetical protein